jgi:hypothetical protein
MPNYDLSHALLRLRLLYTYIYIYIFKWHVLIILTSSILSQLKSSTRLISFSSPSVSWVGLGWVRLFQSAHRLCLSPKFVLLLRYSAQPQRGSAILRTVPSLMGLFSHRLGPSCFSNSHTHRLSLI